MSADFAALDLPDALLLATQQLGYTTPTPIQAQALPPILAGRDVLGEAQTGSGKTAAFGLGLLASLDPRNPAAQALVLCPTRELAEQVADALRGLAQRMADTRVLTLCGGRPSRDQAQGLQGRHQVLVGTPGRVGQHIRLGRLHLAALQTLVLDEADRMLDMGFADQVLEIVEACPQPRRTWLFSATLPESIHALSAQVQQDPEHIRAGPAHVARDTLAQQLFLLTSEDRNQLLVDLLAQHKPSQALVFAETRKDCQKLAGFLQRRGAAALALHGELDQRGRDEALIRFTNGSARVLVSTNLAARGLDIPDLPLVIIAEPSPDPPSHIHRIGRTARAGVDGLALVIARGPTEALRIDRIEAELGHKIPRGKMPPKGGGLHFLAPTHRTLLLRAGRKDKVRKGDVMGALVKECGIPPKAIGRIDLMPKLCAVAVHVDWAQCALSTLGKGKVKGKRVRARLLG